MSCTVCENTNFFMESSWNAHGELLNASLKKPSWKHKPSWKPFGLSLSLSLWHRVQGKCKMHFCTVMRCHTFHKNAWWPQLHTSKHIYTYFTLIEGSECNTLQIKGISTIVLFGMQAKRYDYSLEMNYKI